jgi:YbbR domain-containing protein
VQINQGLVRLVEKQPAEMTILLEPLVTQTYPLTLIVRGEPPDGYQLDTPTVEPAEVTVSGPASVVSSISEVRATIDISGANDTTTRNVTPVPVDAGGKSVSGAVLAPETITVTQPISLLGGFRYVIVKTVTSGQVANGYRLTNIYVTPVGVVVFSSDQMLVDALPGYVETKAIDLTGSDDDFEVLAELDLPEGISVVGDARVLVQVSIAAIESSLAVSLPVEIVGLTPGLQAAVSPTTVDVILAGPVPDLEELEPNDIRAKVDLTGYEAGSYQIIPVVDFLPERIYKVSILPATVEVTITLAPTPTPTPTPLVTPTPVLTPTPNPTPTPTARP